MVVHSGHRIRQPDPCSRREKHDTLTGTSDRSDRILDAAGDLLLRLSHREVDVEDVAKRAGIDKGTVHLHRLTEKSPFEALLVGEASELRAELLRDTEVLGHLQNTSLRSQRLLANEHSSELMTP